MHANGDLEDFRAFVERMLQAELLAVERRVAKAVASWKPVPPPELTGTESRPDTGGRPRTGDIAKRAAERARGTPAAVSSDITHRIPPSSSEDIEVLEVLPCELHVPSTVRVVSMDAPKDSLRREVWEVPAAPFVTTSGAGVPESSERTALTPVTQVRSSPVWETSMDAFKRGDSKSIVQTSSMRRVRMEVDEEEAEEEIESEPEPRDTQPDAFKRTNFQLRGSNTSKFSKGGLTGASSKRSMLQPLRTTQHGSLDGEEEEIEEMVGFRGRVQEFVGGSFFENTSALLIILNGISIGAQTDYMAKSDTEDVPVGLRVVEILFCILFTVELLIRLYVFRMSFFWVRSWLWNTFDFLLVMCQVGEELMAVVVDRIGGGQDVIQASSEMRVLRLLRLVRILRLMRVLRLVGELRTIVHSIQGCLRPFAWTMVLLLLILYVFGTFFTQLVLNHRFSRGELGAELQAYYGSLFLSLLSLYQAITGGIDWETMSTPLITEISPLLGLVFVLYIAFTTMAVLNTVAGVFVESALVQAKRDKEILLENTAYDLFLKLDLDQSGTIEWTEFERQLKKPDLQPYLEAISLDVTEAKTLFSALDDDNGGSIDASEFLNGCIRLRNSAKSLDLLMLAKETRKLFEDQTLDLRRLARQRSTKGEMASIVESVVKVVQGSPPLKFAHSDVALRPLKAGS